MLCPFCTQPHVESKIFYGPETIEVCQEHGDNLEKLYKDVEFYFDDLSKKYTITVVRASELKVGDKTQWQQYLVYVKKITRRPFSPNKMVCNITYGLLGCCSQDPSTCFIICRPVNEWSHQTDRYNDELCIKLIEKPQN